MRVARSWVVVLLCGLMFSLQARPEARQEGRSAFDATIDSPAAENIALQRLIDQVQSSYDRLDSLQAEFTQILHSPALGRPQEEHGLLTLQRPARMRWEYREPEEKLAVVDGERTWLYVPAENQVIVGTLAEVNRSGAAGLLLAGRVDLRGDFSIEEAVPPAGSPPGAATLVLTPLVPGEEFARLDLTVAGDPPLPVRIVVHGQLGDRMEYVLRHLRVNVQPDPALFRFQPPPGVDVVLAE